MTQRPDDPIVNSMERRQYLLQQLRKFRTLAELHGSPFFAESSKELDAIVTTPEIVHCSRAVPRLSSFVRVAQWNLEKGRCWERAVELIQSNDVLRWADVLLLNEADHGMIRSGNVHVAGRSASALGMNMAFCPAHLELTKGTGGELRLDGENCESLQGNAVLSRYPILEARAVPLPACFEPFEFHEKRYGRRNCVWARLQIGAGSAWVGAAHLEVRDTPRCRALQMRHLMARTPGSEHEPHLLGGDLNTNGFPRGTRWRTLRSIARLLLRHPEEVKEELRHPERRTEPLFRIVRQAKFAWEGLNSFRETASAPIGDLEDSALLPDFFIQFIRRRFEPFRGRLEFKLDWLLSRGVRALRSGEMLDSGSGTLSLDPACIPLERVGPNRISDHSPIFADIRL
jgi:endonuclease/exonuclease/phosphatase family metal-dependent hydrolase